MNVMILIYCHPGKAERLREYEQKARPLIEKHGGRFVSIWEGLGGEEPDEIHLLEFESESGFRNFRQDPQLKALTPLRAEAVARSQVIGVHPYDLEQYFKGS